MSVRRSATWQAYFRTSTLKYRGIDSKNTVSPGFGDGRAFTPSMNSRYSLATPCCHKRRGSVASRAKLYDATQRLARATEPYSASLLSGILGASQEEIVRVNNAARPHTPSIGTYQ